VAFFVATSAEAGSSAMLFARDSASAFQRSRFSLIFAKQYFRLLFSRLAALHLAFHLSRLPQKNRSNLEIGLRYGNDSLIDIEPPPCNVPRGSGGNTATDFPVDTLVRTMDSKRIRLPNALRGV
jgi:hypothetical protein